MKSRNLHSVYIDTNVLIGEWIGRPDDVECIKYLKRLAKSNKGNKKDLYVSSLGVVQFISHFENKKGFSNEKITDKVVNDILKNYSVVSCSGKDISNAVKINGKDLEDNIHYVLSGKVDCMYFVTNNKKDYLNFCNTLNIIKAKEYRSIL